MVKCRQLILLLLLPVCPAFALAQEQIPNPKIGKHEFEFSGSFLGSNYSEFGAELIYRRPAGKLYKLGGGARLSFGSLNEPRSDLYPGLLLDATRFIDRRQKWTINVQCFYSFYSKETGTWPGYDPVKGFYEYSLKRNMGFTYILGGNHRSLISRGKKQILTSLFLSMQNVELNYFRIYQANPGQTEIDRLNKLYPGVGIKVGIVF